MDMFEIGSVIILGIFAQWVAWKLKIPSILPLILTGLAVGPLSQYYLGQRIISPVYDPESEQGLFPGNTLYYFTSLAIGLILFEGGLTLKRKELKGLGRAITRLVSIGAAFTFIGGGIAAHYIMGLDWMIAFLFSSLIIVTGPTVITPILRNINLKKKVSTVLKWEGILIDPIGAFVAVLVFKFIVSAETTGEINLDALKKFVQGVLIGFSLGAISGYAFNWIIKRAWIPHYLLNTVTLAYVLGAFIFSDALVHESGLLTVVVMGMTIANLDTPHYRDILEFKEHITILLLSILFILLSANMSIQQLQSVLTPQALALFLVIVFALRPLAVFTSITRSDLSRKEKTLIAWVGPRGIVAAGVASLFGIQLETLGVQNAELITPLVFLIVLGTVLLNATTAGWVAKILGVTLHEHSGILIIGANPVARRIGQYLQEHGRRVVLIDTSGSNVEEALEMDLEAYQEDIFNDQLEEKIELADTGHILALTPSDEVNARACNLFSKTLGRNGAYRLPTQKEIYQSADAKNTLFSPIASFLILSSLLRKNDNIHEIELTDERSFAKVIEKLRAKTSIPLFQKDQHGRLSTILSGVASNTIGQTTSIVYVGERIEEDLVEATPARS